MLCQADSILSLLAHRGLVDNDRNRFDVNNAAGVLASLRPWYESLLCKTTIAESIERGQAPGGRLIDCTCSSPRYDGDDGWNRDCPEHGADTNA